MTSLLGRLIPLFSGSRRVEDLFTETVARLFERRPDLCLSWLEGANLLPHANGKAQRQVSVATQKRFLPLEHHQTASRPDLWIEIYESGESFEREGVSDVFIVESKIDAVEGGDQLRRYAENLDRMTGHRTKTLLYITRAYDPKVKEAVLSKSEGVSFEQLRWHDFYRFLQTVEKKDALLEEVMAFMEEQGMARSYRFSTMDLIALSGLPRVVEILDETLDEEVRAAVEVFAGNKMKHEAADRGNLTRLGRYFRLTPLHGEDLRCFVGYSMRTEDGYPVARVQLEMRPHALQRSVSHAGMEVIVSKYGWHSFDLDSPGSWSGIFRDYRFADLLREEDHVAEVKAFFVESIRQLREELTAFKSEHPDLPWNGGQDV